MNKNPNNPDNFIFGDNETNGIPSVLVDLAKVSLSTEQLSNLSSEFYGKVAENQLAVAGENGDSDEIIVAFLPDVKNPSDPFTCRRAFTRALACYTKQY